MYMLSFDESCSFDDRYPAVELALDAVPAMFPPSLATSASLYK